MSGRIQWLVGLTGLVALLLLSGVGVSVPNTARAGDCLTAPNSPAPQGIHWYYRLDRTNQRKCWYLRAPAQPAQQAAAPAMSEAAPAAQSHLIIAPSGPTPAAPAASGPMSINPSDGAATRVRMLAVKPKPASMDALKPKPVSLDALVQRSAHEGNSGHSIPAVSAPQASASSQTSAQAAGLGPAATVAWQDPPPAVVTVKAPESSGVSAIARVQSVRPSADAQSPDDAEISAPQPTVNAGNAGSLTSTPAVMFLIFALGLLAAGTLSRVLMKIAALRTQAHPQTDFDEQRQHEPRNGQEYGFVDERHEGESLIADASDYDSRHLLRPDEECSDNAYGEDGAFQIAVGKRENRLAQLSQDCSGRSGKSHSPKCRAAGWHAEVSYAWPRVQSPAVHTALRCFRILSWARFGDKLGVASTIGRLHWLGLGS